MQSKMGFLFRICGLDGLGSRAYNAHMNRVKIQSIRIISPAL